MDIIRIFRCVKICRDIILIDIHDNPKKRQHISGYILKQQSYNIIIISKG